MPVITIESAAFKKLMDRLSSLEKAIRATSPASTAGRWLTQEEAEMLTGLKARSLREKRKKGEFGFSTATGRKIKYLRKDIENYLNNNSTLKQ